MLEDREAAGTKHAALVQAEKLAELAGDEADTLIVPEDVHKTLGMTLAQVKAARPTRDYDARYGKTTGPWTTDMFVEAAYNTLKK